MFLVCIWGFTGTMGLILLTCSLFLLVSGLHFIVCSSIDTPLYLFDPWPAFYHCLLCPCGFLAKSRVYVLFHADFGPKVAYIHSCSLYSHVHPPFWWVWCWGKLLGGLWVWLGLPWVWCCLLDASFVTRDRSFIDFSLKVVLVIFPFCFAISALLFLSWCLAGLVFYTCCRDWEF